MPFYAVLGKFTDEGAKHLKESPKYFKQIEAAVEKAGGKTTWILLYDGRI